MTYFWGKNDNLNNRETYFYFTVKNIVLVTYLRNGTLLEKEYLLIWKMMMVMILISHIITGAIIA